jgi:hypothetical protein
MLERCRHGRISRRPQSEFIGKLACANRDLADAVAVMDLDPRDMSVEVVATHADFPDRLPGHFPAMPQGESIRVDTAQVLIAKGVSQSEINWKKLTTHS